MIEPPKVNPLGVGEFNCILRSCRRGVVIAHPGTKTYPSYHYLDELSRFLGSPSSMRTHPGMEFVSFYEMNVQQADKPSLEVLSSELGQLKGLFSLLPVSIFVTNGNVTHSACLPLAIPANHIGYYLYTMLKAQHIIPEAAARPDLPRQA